MDKKYSTQEEKEQVEELYLNEYDLKGELDLSKFILLEKIFISYFLDESKINFKNKQEGIEIIKCVKAQVTFDKEYPVNQFCLGILDKKNKGKNRSEITQINLSNNYLEEFLEINGFLNLEEIDLANNKLTSLILIDCFKVEKINCSQNTLDQLPDFFSSLDHSFLENELNVPDTCSLTHLNISNNNISEDLSVFSHLVNLE